MNWSELRAWIFILAIVFLFVGEPDVWDRLHDKAMNVEQCK